MSYTTPIVRFVMVREKGQVYEARPMLKNAADAYRVMRDYLAPEVDGVRQEPTVEHFIAAYITIRHRLIALHTISIGSLGSTLVHPREVFAPAMELRAAAVIVGHNHPTGDADPSADDMAVSRKLAAAGEIVGIQLLDHVIVGDGRYMSMKERGVI